MGSSAPEPEQLLTWLASDLAGLAGVPWAPAVEDFRSAGDGGLALLHEQARSRGVLAPEIDLETLRGIAERVDRNARALRAHRPTPYAGPVLLVRGTEGADAATTARWRELLPASELVELPGNHFTLMREPTVSRLAQIVAAGPGGRPAGTPTAPERMP